MDLETKRKKLHKFLGHFLKNATIVDKLPDDTYIVCSLAEGFDLKSNEVWIVEANKSYPRDINCGTCKKQIVMSGGTLKMFDEAGRKHEVICGKCLLDKLEKEKNV